MSSDFERPLAQLLRNRVGGPRSFIQLLVGPRQVGKTTLVHQVRVTFPGRSHFASADLPGLTDASWVEQQWQAGRALASTGEPCLLALDEVQKVPGWSETVKRLWDEDTAAELDLRVVLLGSSPLLLQGGSSESLTGRFEMIRVTHWSFAEMRAAFGLSLDQWLFYGGYPGAIMVAEDEERWRRYILDSLIETTISRDIQLMTRIDKPALLRRLFALGCDYSGQILSYQKMIGQLQDAGNTTTLAHYLDVLGAAGLVMGLPKHAGERVRQRAASPKLLVLNTALMTSMSFRPASELLGDPELRGRLVETAVGAHLVNGLLGTNARVGYWREGELEVDYVVERGNRRLAIEVKSGRPRSAPPGLAAFESRFGPCRKLLVSSGGLDLEAFFLTDPVKLL
jgi:predicted AAA+ superfamily ATPase